MKHRLNSAVRAIAISGVAGVVLPRLDVRAQADKTAILGECFLTGDARVEYDSNIYGNSSEVGDTIFRLTPGGGWKHDSGLLGAKTATGVEFERFAKHTSADSNNPYVNAGIDWSDTEGKTDGALAASWRRVSAANELVFQRTRSDDTSVNAVFGHFVTEKLGYRLKETFLDQDYLTAGYSSVRNWSSGVEGRYQYSPKLEAIFGYTYRDSRTRDRAVGHPDVDSYDQKILVGFDGELLSKVKGRLAGGVVTRKFTAGFGHRETGLLLETAIDWTPAEDTTVTLLGRQDFDTSPADQSVRKLLTELGLRRMASEKLAVGGSIGCQQATYTGGAVGRDEHTIYVRSRVSYQFTRLIDGGCDIAYRDTHSSLEIAQSRQVLLAVSLGLKF